jgi:N-acetylneuraminic acid mutarotase
MEMARRVFACFQLSLLLSFSAFTSASLTAQGLNQGEWTWMSGASTIPNYVSTDSGISGVYGKLGTFAATNTPGSRYGEATWVDASGNFWLFGGAGYASDTAFGSVDDLWEYSPAINQWAWMGGNSASALVKSEFGVYGTLGVPSANNLPGGRSNAVTWVDANGNFWLFGGYGYAATGAGVLNDLWTYSPFSHEWTWMGGSSVATDSGLDGISGVYGSVGQASSTTYPGSRVFAAGWADSNGNLWLFGGAGFDSVGTDGVLNDLWKYDPAANRWTWVSGSNAAPGQFLGQPGVYGTLGVPAPGNVPAGREIGAEWTDKAGNFWLFGGWGSEFNGKGDFLNDLWKFNPATNEWTWRSGSPIIAGYGSYGTLGVASAANCPGGRVYSVSWTDANGNLWLFGGNGFAADGFGDTLNDLWEFIPTSGEWVWMGGSSDGNTEGDPGAYGTLGVPAAPNTPGARDLATAWTDNHGIFWFFGGTGKDSANNFGVLNDLWNFQVAGTLPPAPAPTFSSASGSYPAGTAITLSDTASGATIYYTTDGKTVPTVNSQVYTGPVSLTTPETIQAIAVASGYAISYVAGATYTLPAATPTFSVPAGTYTSMQTVTISDATPGSTIYYTTDGSAPTTSSTLYEGTITVSQSETLSAIAIANGYLTSSLAKATYTINLPPPDFTIAALPASFTVNSGQAVTAAITITPANGFNAAVSFACSGLPAGVTCSFTPATVTPSASPVSTTLTLLTSQSAAVSGSRPWTLSPMVLSLTCCLFFWRKMRRQILSLVLLALALSISGLSGCGSSSGTGSSTGRSQSVTSLITVTASAGSLQHGTVVSLTMN